MYPVSERFLNAITGTHRAVSKARLLTSTQFGPSPTGQELPILSGDVKLSATADVKSTLELTIPGDYWVSAQPYGAEIWVARGVVFGDGTEELVPLGYFRIDTIEQEDAPYGPVTLSCSDRISQLKQNRVLYPFQVPAGYTHRQLFERLVNGRLSPGANTPAPDQTQAAILIHDRFLLGQPIFEDWTWTGAPALVGTYNDPLLALYRAGGGIPAQTEAAILIDDRILCHAPINSDWTWTGMPSVVGTFKDELIALYLAAGSPEPTVWLQDYITANGGTMPTQTRAATIIRARLESGLTINADWTWPDPPQIVTQYSKTLVSQYSGSPTDRPAAIAWLGSYVNSHGGSSSPDPVSWLEGYITANGGFAAINSLGYAALIQGPPVPIIWDGYDPDRYTIDGGPVVENSTYEFMAKLVDARECTLRFDELGQLHVEPREVDVDTAADWVIQPGRTGNLIKASRKTDRDGYYNIVVAYGSDPASPTGYQLAYNRDPNSPLRWDSQFGAAARYYASPLLRTPGQAADAAATILSRYTGLPTTLGLWTIPNPAIRPQDVVAAKVTGLSETHTVDVVTIPLAIAGAGPVQIDTRTLNEVVIPDAPDVPNNGTTSPVPSAAQILQEKCFQLTSTAENSTVQWWTQFGYLEDIGDGRGYTTGIAGFTSATGDLLDVVRQFASTKPGNVLQPFIPGLQTCATVGMGGSASSAASTNLGTPFRTAWAQAATDPVFQQVQISYRNRVYWTPAYNQAIADGVSNLGLAIYYDTCINHGAGSPSENDGSFDDIRAATTGTTPRNGGSEATWLTNFLSARSTVLTAWGDNPPNGRISMFTGLISAANFTLTVPVTWSVYGDSYTMTQDPYPYGWTAPPTTGGGSAAFANPGQAHNIGSAAGQNTFNIGIGFDNHPTYGTAHRDFTRAEIEAGLSVPGYYELNAAGEVLMSAHPGGGRTSSNTNYARTEYRELERDGTTKMAFNPSQGRHYIRGRSTVEAPMATAKPETCIAQYHDASDDTVMIHVRDTDVRVKVRGTIVATIATGWTHGTFADWMIEVVSGRVNVYWNNMTTPAYTTTTFSGSTAGWYGKAGDYMQWNTSNGDATICRVRLINLEHWHSVSPRSTSPWPTPARPATSSGGTTGSGGSTGTGSTGGASTADDGVEAAKLLSWGAVIDGDEFQYSGAPNPAKWNPYDGPGHDGNGIRTPRAFNVSNGILTCTGDANANSGGMSFSRSQKYYRVEWRIRTSSINPKGSGFRYHPVLILWPTSDSWPQGGEFDFAEYDCDSGLYEAFLHIPGNDGSAQEYVKRQFDISQWHNVAFEWSKSGIKGWVNGQQVFSFPGFKQPPGPMEPTFQLDAFRKSGLEPATFQAQWFRIYTSPT